MKKLTASLIPGKKGGKNKETWESRLRKKKKRTDAKKF